MRIAMEFDNFLCNEMMRGEVVWLRRYTCVKY